MEPAGGSIRVTDRARSAGDAARGRALYPGSCRNCTMCLTLYLICMFTQICGHKLSGAKYLYSYLKDLYLYLGGASPAGSRRPQSWGP